MVVESAPFIIQLRQVTLYYGADDVVRNVDLDIRQGETKVILGPSGVGKSTILKAILGLIKPRHGNIFVHGRDISQFSEREMVPIRRRMAMVFQNGALFDSMTIGDNVSYRLREMSLSDAKTIERRVHEVLNFVGLKGAKKLRPAQLSGGMRKRVAIARALASNPEVFLFDEPTVGLDPINHYNVEQLILKLKHESKATLLVVTHDIESAMRIADSVVMLYEGRFIFEGPPQDLKKNTDNRIRAFLNPSEAGMLLQ